ncbi:MAG: hypothetical protein MJZ90_12070 [Bacteroidales bacterium]|nr:hypothetical protein [Bacteroidales bacterium]
MEINSEYDNPGDILTLSDITGQFGTKTQRQDYYEPKQETASDGLDPSLTDPDGEASAESPALDFMDASEPEGEVSPERCRRTGQRIAKAIDTGFNFVASNFIAKDSGNEYKADKSDLADLGEAWGELAEEKHWEMSPVWQVLILSAMVYIPLARQAFNDRRFSSPTRRTSASSPPPTTWDGAGTWC